MTEEEIKMVHRRSFLTVFLPLMLSQVTLCFSINYVFPRGSSASFSCSSNVSPVWNSVKDSQHVQSLAFGDQRMARFKDERYEKWILSLTIFLVSASNQAYCTCTLDIVFLSRYIAGVSIAGYLLFSSFES